MIFFKFLVQNPWFRPTNHHTSKDYYYHHINLTKHKNFEIQISRFDPCDLVNVSVDLRWWGSDHQGPELEINLMGLMFLVKIYDSRHWDYTENTWIDPLDQENAND